MPSKPKNHSQLCTFLAFSTTSILAYGALGGAAYNNLIRNLANYAAVINLIMYL